MSVKLYVGGLSPATDDASLLGAFSEFGEISEAKVVTQGDSGASRGFGFVTFAGDPSGERAISARDGSVLDGSTIAVSVARPRAVRARSPFGR